MPSSVERSSSREIDREQLLLSAGCRGPTPTTAITSGGISYRDLPNKWQLTILCLVRLIEPLASTSIQSYVFYQLKFFDPAASAATISTRAGILVGARTAAQVCTGMLWGRLADSEIAGRKIVLLIGLVCDAVAYAGYGLARTFFTAVLWQILSGAMSSNVAMVRCCVAEQNSDKRFRTRALLLLPLFANAGMLLGPLLGGLLIPNPEALRAARFPFLLPNLVLSVAYLVIALGLAMGLEETLESLRNAQESLPRRYCRRIKRCCQSTKSSHASPALVQVESQALLHSEVDTARDVAKPPTVVVRESAVDSTARGFSFKEMWTFNVSVTLVSHFVITGHLNTFAILWSIFLSTPTSNLADRKSSNILQFTGGLGMAPRDVGFAMSSLGGLGLLLQSCFYPMLQDRFGTIRIWRAALFIFPVTYMLAPFPSLLAPPMKEIKEQDALTWLAILPVLVLFVVGRTGVTPATTLLINDCTPHPSFRATIHATANVVGNLSRTIFPLGALALYGYGIRLGVIGMGFWCLAIVAMMVCIISSWVKEGSNGMDGDAGMAPHERTSLLGQKSLTSL